MTRGVDEEVQRGERVRVRVGAKCLNAHVGTRFLVLLERVVGVAAVVGLLSLEVLDLFLILLH